MHKKAASLLLALSITLLGFQSVQAAPRDFGTYQLDFLPIATSLGSAIPAEATASELTRLASLAFEDTTQGRIKFSFRRVLPEYKAKEKVESVFQVGKFYGVPAVADPGFAGIFVVGVIAHDPTLLFAGQSDSGQNLIMNGPLFTDGFTVQVLAHELGQNFYLRHADTSVCNVVNSKVSCDRRDYGDKSDPMGGYMIGYYSNPPLARFSATMLDQLGLISAAEQTEVLDSGNFTIVPVYPLTRSGVRLLKIPIEDEVGYTVEYRDPVGVEAQLAATQIDIPGENSYYATIPSYGFQLRMVKPLGTHLNGLLPLVNYEPFGGTALVVDSQNGRQGFDVGRSQTLSDGTVVTFTSYDTNEGAKIQIIRPKESAPPTINSPTFRMYTQNGSYYLTNELTIKKTFGGAIEWPIFKLDTDAISDNRRLKSISLLFNGQIVATQSDVPLGLKLPLTYNPTRTGIFAVTVEAKDYLGNTSTGNLGTFSLTKYVLPKPWIESSIKDDVLTIMVNRVATKNIKYEISGMSSGNLMDQSNQGDITTFTVSGLRNKQNFVAQFLGTDEFGNTDDGSTLETEIPGLTCSSSKCYVGIPWEANSLYWKTNTGKLELQEKVANKWRTIKTATAIKDLTGHRGYSYTYKISMTYVQPGLHTYRLYIAASKKFTAWMGSTFTQAVLP